MMVLLKSYQNVLRHQLGLIFSTLNGFWVVHGLKFRGWGCPLGPSGITASSSMRRLWRSVTLATRSPITERSHPNFSDVKHVGENEIQSDLFFTVCSFFYIFSSHWHISSLKVSMLGVPVISNSLWPHRLQPARLLCPWDSLGKNTGVDCHALLQGHLPNPGFEPAASHVSCIGRQDLYHKRDLWTDSTLGPGDVRQTKHLLPLGGSQF